MVEYARKHSGDVAAHPRVDHRPTDDDAERYRAILEDALRAGDLPKKYKKPIAKATILTLAELEADAEEGRPAKRMTTTTRRVTSRRRRRSRPRAPPRPRTAVLGFAPPCSRRAARRAAGDGPPRSGNGCAPRRRPRRRRSVGRCVGPSSVGNSPLTNPSRIRRCLPLVPNLKFVERPVRHRRQPPRARPRRARAGPGPPSSGGFRSRALKDAGLRDSHANSSCARCVAVSI